MARFWVKGAAGYWAKSDIITVDNWWRWIICKYCDFLSSQGDVAGDVCKSACAFIKANLVTGYDDGSMVCGWWLTAGIGRAVRTGWVTSPLQPGALCSNENTTCDHKLRATLLTGHRRVVLPCACAAALHCFMYYTLLTWNNKKMVSIFDLFMNSRIRIDLHVGLKRQIVQYAWCRLWRSNTHN